MKRVLVVALVAAACHAPPSAHGDASAEPTSACTKLGATCTFSPGKLGTCVEVDESAVGGASRTQNVEQPSGASTFVCQSQH